MRLAHPLHPSFQAAGLWLLPAVLLVGLPLVALTGQVKGLTRYVGSRALDRLAGRNGLLVLLLAGLGVMLRLPMPPLSSWHPALVAALRLAGNHQIVSFLDDAPSLWWRTINGIPIQPPQVLSQIQEQLYQVLLAIPSLPRSERRRIVAELQRQAIPVLQIPSVDDLTSGRARIDALRPVAIEDLLGRDPVPPVPELLG